MAAVGTIVWLSSELMFFAGLFAIYFTLRAVRPDLWAMETPKLNVTFATLNTLILVISSVWCQLGVHRAEQGRGSRVGGLFDLRGWGMREWYVLTYIFGGIFVAGQVFEYAELTMHGVTLYSNAYGSAFYMTTGFHAIHVAGGLVAFLFIIGGKSNNTDIHETFRGMADALREHFGEHGAQPLFVVVGRGGPNLVRGMAAMRDTCEALGIPFVSFGFDSAMSEVVDYARKVDAWMKAGGREQVARSMHLQAA